MSSSMDGWWKCVVTRVMSLMEIDRDGAIDLVEQYQERITASVDIQTANEAARFIQRCEEVGCGQ